MSEVRKKPGVAFWLVVALTTIAFLAIIAMAVVWFIPQFLPLGSPAMSPDD